MKIYTLDNRCAEAAREVDAYVARHPEWRADVLSGKMFGVLVCEEETLWAFSGTLGGRTLQDMFVPPVFDLQHPGSYFLEEEARISAINHRLESSGVTASEICDLRHERKERSRRLQQWLFSQFSFLNIKGERATLQELFSPLTPPAGAGDCCAPKLLQEAFRRHLHPVALAEWSQGEFYPPCLSKCRPIMLHMLQGLDAEPDPRLTRYEALIPQLTVVHEDDSIIVVDKPSGLLSVPGKDNYPSVSSLINAITVHRLDQDTSGLMVMAKNMEVHKFLQKQFERHEVHKRYAALLENPMTVGAEGDIALPLCPDIADRPRQMVSETFGKYALTHYRIIDNVQTGEEGTLRHALVHLFPSTGRTHQLRVHCSHKEGLDNPILGDRLYGTPGQRLMLHAEELHFIHPQSQEEVFFHSPARFMS